MDVFDLQGCRVTCTQFSYYARRVILGGVVFNSLDYRSVCGGAHALRLLSK
jgi:hypothetical protein